MNKIIILTLFFFSLNLSSASTLYVYGWFNSVPEHVIKRFIQENGINVSLSSYENNETMYAKLKLVKHQLSYDITFPSTYFIQRMVNEDLLEKLNKNKIPNIKNIDHEILNLNFDPHNTFTIPYAMYFTGIMYNSGFIKQRIDSWLNLFNPRYKNMVLLLDDIREVFHIGLNLLGYNSSTVNEKEIKDAYFKLKSLIDNVCIFASESTKKHFLSGDISIGMSWNQDAYESIAENDDLKFIYPKEGSIFSTDNFAILKTSKNKDNAYKFINFICRADIAKEIIKSNGLSLPNFTAKKLLPIVIQNNKVIYPNNRILKTRIIHSNLGVNAKIYMKYWNMLKIKD